MENKLKKYKQITEICYPNYPRDFFEKIMKIKSKYKSKMVYVSKNKEIVGGGLVIKLGENIYGICGVVINPIFQRKGFGSKLMRKIHNMYKGMFLLNVSKDITNFYTELGYQLLDNEKDKILMYYLNDRRKFYF